ncbi:hypothetical protein, partial [Escherichia coli]|uniref:hypothetical protein n=1 Tax=Escherichia coli TaxID=562 RepID=UPI00193B50B2
FLPDESGNGERRMISPAVTCNVFPPFRPSSDVRQSFVCASLGGEKHQVTHKRNSVGRQTTGGTAEKRCT